MHNALFFALAAATEIAGCYAFWSWARLGKSPAWLGVGLALLAVFAWALTRIDSPAAGRAFAAYGGIYIAASVLFLWAMEGVRPDRWDIGGAALCLIGAAIIIAAPRAAA